MSNRNNTDVIIQELKDCIGVLQMEIQHTRADIYESHMSLLQEIRSAQKSLEEPALPTTKTMQEELSNHMRAECHKALLRREALRQKNLINKFSATLVQYANTAQPLMAQIAEFQAKVADHRELLENHLD
jgi:hypothetical protein